jgi:hypothetical protein
LRPLGSEWNQAQHQLIDAELRAPQQRRDILGREMSSARRLGESSSVAE